MIIKPKISKPTLTLFIWLFFSLELLLAQTRPDVDLASLDEFSYSGLCTGCVMNNHENAYDGDTTTFAALDMVGISNTVTAHYEFSNSLTAGDEIILTLAFDEVTPILNVISGVVTADVFTNLGIHLLDSADNFITTYNSFEAVGISLVNESTNKFLIKFNVPDKKTGSYGKPQKIDIELTGVALLSGKLNIYDILSTTTNYTYADTHHSSGVSDPFICIGCNVSDPEKAVVNPTTGYDPNNDYAQLTKTAGVGGEVFNRVDWTSPFSSNRNIYLTLEDASGLLNLDLLGDAIRFEIIYSDSAIDTINNIIGNNNLISATLLYDNANKYLITLAPENYNKMVKGVQIVVEQSVLGLLSVDLNLRFYNAYHGEDTLTEPLPGDYAYYKKITVEAEDVPSDQNNYPLLVKYQDDTDLRHVSDGGHVEMADGCDIVFALESDLSTRLDHDLELYESGTGGADVISWVRIPFLSSSENTVIYMFYGNSAETCPTTNADGTWDESYNGVWHLSQTPDTNTGTYEILDSSGQDNHGTSNGNMGVSNIVDSKVGKGLDFDGTNDYVTIPDDDADLEPSSFTISCWFRRDNGQAAYAKMFSKGKTSNPYASYTLELRGDQETGGFQTGRTDNNYTLIETPGSTITNDTSWHYFVGTFDNSTKTQQFYIDGTLVGSNNSNSSTIDYYNPTGYDLAIGALSTGNNPFNGSIDELHLQNVVRDADWIAIEFANLDDPLGFASSGPEESSILLSNKLLNFKAEKINEKVKIFWETGLTSNKHNFVVEKSSDGADFYPLERIFLMEKIYHGFKRYEVEDLNPYRPLTYYRIKEIDEKGKIHFSNVVDIQFYNPTTTCVIYAQVERRLFEVEVNAEHSGSFHYIISEISGKLILKGNQSVPKGKSIFHYDLPQNQPGVYIFKLFYYNRFTETAKLFISN